CPLRPLPAERPHGERRAAGARLTALHGRERLTAARRLGAELALQRPLHLTRVRETAEDSLREEQLAAPRHFEDPAGLLHQPRIDPESLLQRGRQTDGARLV